MSDVRKLLAQSETVEIEGVEFKIDPLDTDDPDVMTLLDDVTTKERTSALMRIVDKIIKASHPDLSDEELKKFPLGLKGDLAGHVARVSKLDQKDSSPESALKARLPK